jgi:hypothetical protein
MLRTFFLAATFTAALMVSTTANPVDPHHANAFIDCAKACDDCGRSCESCAAHCGRMLVEGKKEHVATHRFCVDCSTTCRAASAIVARQGPFSDLICVACADACKQCGDACEKMKGDPVMKQCAEECRKCETACREMLKFSKAAETK